MLGLFTKLNQITKISTIDAAETSGNFTLSCVFCVTPALVAICYLWWSIIVT